MAISAPELDSSATFLSTKHIVPVLRNISHVLEGLNDSPVHLATAFALSANSYADDQVSFLRSQLDTGKPTLIPVSNHPSHWIGFKVTKTGPDSYTAQYYDSNGHSDAYKARAKTLLAALTSAAPEDITIEQTTGKDAQRQVSMTCGDHVARWMLGEAIDALEKAGLDLTSTLEAFGSLADPTYADTLAQALKSYAANRETNPREAFKQLYLLCCSERVVRLTNQSKTTDTPEESTEGVLVTREPTAEVTARPLPQPEKEAAGPRYTTTASKVARTDDADAQAASKDMDTKVLDVPERANTTSAPKAMSHEALVKMADAVKAATGNLLTAYGLTQAHPASDKSRMTTASASNMTTFRRPEKSLNEQDCESAKSAFRQAIHALSEAVDVDARDAMVTLYNADPQSPQQEQAVYDFTLAVKFEEYLMEDGQGVTLEEEKAAFDHIRKEITSARLDRRRAAAHCAPQARAANLGQDVLKLHGSPNVQLVPVR